MRFWRNGRGNHPSIVDPTGALVPHLWTFDEGNAAYPLWDLRGRTNMAPGTSPGIVGTWSYGNGSPIGGVRTFTGAQNFASDSDLKDDTALLTDKFTIFCVFRTAEAFTANGTIYQYGGGGTGGMLIRMRLLAARTIELTMTDNAEGTVQTFTSGFVVPEGKWTATAVVYTQTDNTVSLFINGALAEFWNVAALGTRTQTGQFWTVGCSGGTWTDYFKGEICTLMHAHHAYADVDVEDEFRRMFLLDQDTTIHYRTTIEDALGVFQDMSSQGGFDWQVSVDFNDNVDLRVSQANVVLWRTQGDGSGALQPASVVGSDPQPGNLSLSKFHDNPMNRSPQPNLTDLAGGTYTAETEFLDINRKLRIDICRMPVGQEPTASDWQPFFNGRINDIDWGGDGDTVKVTANDAAQDVMDCWIKGDVVDSSQDPKYPADADLGTGTCDATHGPIESALRQMLADAESDWGMQNNRLYGLAAAVLLVPISPAVCFAQQQVPRAEVMTTLNTWAESIGWAIKIRWNPKDNYPGLTLYQPARTTGAALPPQSVLTPEDYFSIPGATLSLANIRNECTVLYPSEETSTPTFAPNSGLWRVNNDSATTDALNVAYVTVRADDSNVNNDSIARFGLRRCEITESASKPIRNLTQARAMALSVVRDLSLPVANVSINARPLPEAFEIGEYLRLRGNGWTHTGNLDLGVIDHSLKLSSKEQTSTIQVRGTPSGGLKSHLKKEARSGRGLPGTKDAQSAKTVMNPRDRYAIREFLQSETRMARQDTGAIAKNPTFVQSAGQDRVPDNHELSSGTWGASGTVYVSTTNAVTGYQSVAFNRTLGTGGIKTDFLDVIGNHIYSVMMRVKQSAPGTDGINCTVEFYDRDGTSIGTSPFLFGGAVIPDTTFREFTSHFNAPAGARFATLDFTVDAGSTIIYLDSYEIHPVRDYVHYTVRAENEYPVANRTWQNMVWSYQVPRQFDNAVSVTTDADPAGLVSANVFTARQWGRYRVTVSGVQLTPAQTNAPISARLRVVTPKGTHVGTLESNRNLDGTVTSNTIFPGIDAVMWLNQGDTITVQIWIDDESQYTPGGTVWGVTSDDSQYDDAATLFIKYQE